MHLRAPNTIGNTIECMLRCLECISEHLRFQNNLSLHNIIIGNTMHLRAPNTIGNTIECMLRCLECISEHLRFQNNLSLHNIIIGNTMHLRAPNTIGNTIECMLRCLECISEHLRFQNYYYRQYHRMHLRTPKILKQYWFCIIILQVAFAARRICETNI